MGYLLSRDIKVSRFQILFTEYFDFSRHGSIELIHALQLIERYKVSTLKPVTRVINARHDALFVLKGIW